MYDYAGIVITPDSIRDGLDSAIISDLFAVVPAEVLWKQSWLPTKEAILQLYPKLHGKISFASVLRTMLLGESIVIIACGYNLYGQLKEVKGRIVFKDNQVVVTGLRYKYRSWREEDLVRLGPKSQAILDLIFEYRLHTTDSLRDTAILCLLCMDEVGLSNLCMLAPPLYNEVDTIRSLSNVV